MKKVLIIGILFLSSTSLHAQSKKDQITQLHAALDSLKNQQQKLVGQIVELNSDFLERSELMKQELKVKDEEMALKEAMITRLKVQIDSLQKLRISEKMGFADGTYGYSVSYGADEDGNGEHTQVGQIIVSNMIKMESFHFDLSVAGGYFDGGIKGVAEFKSSNLALYSDEYCGLLVFSISGNSIEVVEHNCEGWHGAGIHFDGQYDRVSD
jgi:hypothetical protein